MDHLIVLTFSMKDSDCHSPPQLAPGACCPISNQPHPVSSWRSWFTKLPPRCKNLAKPVIIKMRVNGWGHTSASKFHPWQNEHTHTFLINNTKVDFLVWPHHLMFISPIPPSDLWRFPHKVLSTTQTMVFSSTCKLQILMRSYQGYHNQVSHF